MNTTQVPITDRAHLRAWLQEHQNNPPAQQFFDAFPRSTKRGILEWIHNAKKPETRARRIMQTAKLAAENVRVNQPTTRQKP